MRSTIVLCILVFSVAGSSLLMNGCRKTPATPTTPISFITPAGFPQPVYNFNTNPLTEEGFQLGKKIFFDNRLSADGHVSCGSCHQPIAAFTTFEHDRSHGVNNTHTLRNATAIFNLAWAPNYTQDGGAAILDQVYRSHFTSPTEMGESLNNVVAKMRADRDYQQKFAAAFGDERVTEERINKALSQYVVSLVSAGSKYDRVKKGEAGFTAQEQQGYTLFQSKCNSCHTEPLFTDYSFRNVGLLLDAQLNDKGRMRVTGSADDSLKFRVPTLRNVDLTSYYTHDGRFSIFRMMLQHYRFGVQQSTTLDPQLVNGIQMTNAEEDALVAFIRTLTDSSFINNPRFK